MKKNDACAICSPDQSNGLTLCPIHQAESEQHMAEWAASLAADPRVSPCGPYYDKLGNLSCVIR